MRTIASLVVLACLSLGTSVAQINGAKIPSPALGSQVTPAKAQEDLLGMFEGEMVSTAKAMPADKYDFAPASLAIPGASFDGVRTFAAQVKHVAQANYFFASTIGGIKPDVDLKGIGSLRTKEEIVSALVNSFAFLHKSLATLTPANSLEAVSFEGASASRSTVAAFAVAHGFDHYGQMVEYLRMNGIVPPGSAK